MDRALTRSKMENESVFPSWTDKRHDFKNGLQQEVTSSGGLSKRELFAGMAMQGNLACPLSQSAEKLAMAKPDLLAEILVKSSVKYADLLIRELEKSDDGRPPALPVSGPGQPSNGIR